MFLVSFCSCLGAIYWIRVLSREWRCIWSSADLTNQQFYCPLRCILYYRFKSLVSTLCPAIIAANVCGRASADTMLTVYHTGVLHKYFRFIGILIEQTPSLKMSSDTLPGTSRRSLAGSPYQGPAIQSVVVSLSLAWIGCWEHSRVTQVIWDAMTLMWRHSNGSTIKVKHIFA